MPLVKLHIHSVSRGLAELSVGSEAQIHQVFFLHQPKLSVCIMNIFLRFWPRVTGIQEIKDQGKQQSLGTLTVLHVGSERYMDLQGFSHLYPVKISFLIDSTGPARHVDYSFAANLFTRCLRLFIAFM